MEFIDTHNHILPGIDDGAPDIATSIEMARIAAGDGIAAIVATPHVIEGLFEGSDLGERVSALQQELDERDISVRLIKGAEVPMSVCVSGNKHLLQRLSIGGRYLLMESAETTFEQLSRAVYQVRLSGFYPVLAHPERTSYALNSLELIEELVARGEVYCQVTAASFEGIFGSRIQKVCVRMARKGLVHLLASDAHSTGRRSPILSRSYGKLADVIGERAADVSVMDNPRALIDGERLRTITIPGRKSARGRLSRLLGRR
jgi:protein-tyrosine phosphatase